MFSCSCRTSVSRDRPSPNSCDRVQRGHPQTLLADQRDHCPPLHQWNPPLHPIHWHQENGVLRHLQLWCHLVWDMQKHPGRQVFFLRGAVGYRSGKTDCARAEGDNPRMYIIFDDTRRLHWCRCVVHCERALRLFGILGRFTISYFAVGAVPNTQPLPLLSLLFTLRQGTAGVVIIQRSGSDAGHRHEWNVAGRVWATKEQQVYQNTHHSKTHTRQVCPEGEPAKFRPAIECFLVWQTGKRLIFWS